jgi:hypothetical protein
VAASTTDRSFAAGRLNVSAPEPVPSNLQGITYQAAAFGAPIPVGTVLGPYDLLPAAAVDSTNALGCNEFAAGAFAGKGALISRGTCEFGLKVLNAERAGAVFVIIHNNASGGDALISMGAGAVGDQVTVPAVFIGYTNGAAMTNWYATHGAAARFELSTLAFPISTTPDLIANFSSRGPGVGMVLKPDIAAPGVNILAQGYGTGVGEARHLGFGMASGTSMAAPHVSGAAALLRQIHPTWSNAWIKSALMSTAKFLEVYNEDGSPAQPLDMGAGRLDLTNAAEPGVILDPPSLSFGQLIQGNVGSITVNVTNVGAAAETYSLKTVYTGEGFAHLTTVPGMTFEPVSLTLAPGETKSFTVEWDSAAAMGIGDNQGYLVLQGGEHQAHLPAWMRVVPMPQAAKVLIIDNDGSSSLGLPDYTEYYTSTLHALGLDYEVWDADANFANVTTIPDGAELSQYPLIIYQTGDNYQPDGTFTVHTAPTAGDMDILTEYANNGGRILAFGQDLASVTGSANYPFNGNESIFYDFTLGADYLQDSVNDESVYEDSVQLLTGAPGSPFTNTSFDVSAMGDGAANQYYIDEITRVIGRYGCDGPDSGDLCRDQYRPLLKYSAGGNQLKDGYVAMSHRDQPTLERPGVTFLGRSVYFAFGLEGVNNDTGFNTREQLLGAAGAWLLDGGMAQIQAVPMPVGQVTYFQAAMLSLYGGDAVSYRWDFGDGSAFTAPYTSAIAGHTYTAPGNYTVRVETTNVLGTRTIGEIDVTIAGTAPVYTNPVTQTFTAGADAYISKGQPSTNFGNWAFLYAGASDIQRSALSFDLSGISQLFPVQSATLKVYVDAFSGAGTPSILAVHEVTTPWNESTVTWNAPWTAPGGDVAAEPAATAPVSLTAAGAWLEFDVTALVQKWVANPGANNGLLLVEPAATAPDYTSYRLASGEYWFSDFWPKLEVEYLTP